MLHSDLGEPFDKYVQNLIDVGIYSNYDDVLKAALLQHMEHNINLKIAEGEMDIKAGRVEKYTPQLIDRLTEEVLLGE